jgi:hypothetical protein
MHEASFREEIGPDLFPSVAGDEVCNLGRDVSDVPDQNP